MWEPFLVTHDFSRWVKVYSYEEVRNRLDPEKGPIDAFLQEIEDYSLVVIDEAHNLRNSGRSALRRGRPGHHGRQPEEGRAADGDAGQQLADRPRDA